MADRPHSMGEPVKGRHFVLIKVVQETTYHMLYMEGSEMGCVARAGLLLDHHDYVAAQTVREVTREVRAFPVRTGHMENKTGPTARVRQDDRDPNHWVWEMADIVHYAAAMTPWSSAAEAAEDARSFLGSGHDIIIVAEN